MAQVPSKVSGYQDSTYFLIILLFLTAALCNPLKEVLVLGSAGFLSFSLETQVSAQLKWVPCWREVLLSASLRQFQVQNKPPGAEVHITLFVSVYSFTN